MAEQNADSVLQDLVATDIARWLRVHTDQAWTWENEAVQLLASHVIRTVRAEPTTA